MRKDRAIGIGDADDALMLGANSRRPVVDFLSTTQ
jgi:hypothetical protein